ncbi:AMP-binding protein [Nesterenkonia cremea]|uniref:AMP-dependent synthetase n=1 Tax=Nesterenkonia cremea TaxID=1882340 RepID=A0A917ER26_9MICC|nr:AMP-binding protein [Nesterenkonia cremea]GGE68552.1 AMP-dependent synthetase [Nesterenkonia cremea]
MSTFHPPVGFPLRDLPSAHAEHSPSSIALRCGDRERSWAEMARATRSLAQGMHQRGVGHGDFVSLLLRDGVDIVTAAFACYQVGAVPQPLSTSLAPSELAAILELTTPALVVTQDAQSTAELPGDHPTSAVDQLGTDDAAQLPTVISPSWKAPTSGGSTGRPKIILCGQPAELPAFDAEAWQISGEDRFLMTAPLHHNAPFATTMTALFHGAEVTLLERFDPEAVLEQIERHRITWAYLVPTMMRRISSLPEHQRLSYDLTSLGQLWHCAEPCPAWLKEEWISWLGGERIWELYGGTEAQAGCTLSGTEWSAHRGSVGRPRWGEITLFDDQCAEITEPGIPGDVYMRVSPGSPPAFRYIGAELKEVDGWSTLGDIGEFDTDGYLYLHDRRSDMITVGGVNVYPAEVESALTEHPEVLSAAVIGLPEDDLGSSVHAIVQLSTPGQNTYSLSTEQLQEFLTSRLSRHKRPTSIEFVQTSLRDEAGKVRRAALRRERLSPEGIPTEPKEVHYA